MPTSVVFPLLLLIGLLTPIKAHLLPPEGHPINWNRNGQSLKLRVLGHELAARTVDEDNYTVIHSDETGCYHFAQLSADGQSLIPSPHLAHLPPPPNLKPGLTLPLAQLTKAAHTHQSKVDREDQKHWRKKVAQYEKRSKATQTNKNPNALSAKTTPRVIKGITLLVQFAEDAANNEPAVRIPVTRSKIDDILNKKDYRSPLDNAGSVRDYFFDQSNGQLEYTNIVIPIVTLPKPRHFYDYQDYPQKQTLRDMGAAGELLIKDAVDLLGKTDPRFQEATQKENGNLLAFNVFYAGDLPEVFTKGLWPHRGAIWPPIALTADDRSAQINRYQITNLSSSSPPPIGTFVHETGHLLFHWPDLYDLDLSSNGLGQHCLMSSGNWAGQGFRPTPLNPWLKTLEGWITPKKAIPGHFFTHSLDTETSEVIAIEQPSRHSETFYLEERSANGRWTQDAPASGVLVWHVDSSVKSGNRVEDRSPDAHYLVSLVQADGRFDLENKYNYGDAKDSFNSHTRKEINSLRIPAFRWWDGSHVPHRFTVMDGPEGQVRVTNHRDALTRNPLLLAPSQSGSLIYQKGESHWLTHLSRSLPNSRQTITFEPVDPTTADVVSLSSQTWPESGNNVRIPWALEPAVGYRIRLQDPRRRVDVTSEEVIYVHSELFPDGGVVPPTWTTDSDATAGFVVTDTEAIEGRWSLVSPEINPNEKVAMSVSGTFKAGEASFQLKTDTPRFSNPFSFYVDGEQVFESSGENHWQRVSVQLPAGHHTLTWRYDQNINSITYNDRVWIDNVQLPLATPSLPSEIAELSVMDFGQIKRFGPTEELPLPGSATLAARGLGASLSTDASHPFLLEGQSIQLQPRLLGSLNRLTRSASHHAFLRIHDLAGTIIHRIPLTADLVHRTDFSAWAQQKAPDQPLREDDDADNDGRSNLLEFQMGTNPFVPDQLPLQVSFSTTEISSEKPTPQFSTPTQAGYRYWLEKSTTLAADSWTAMPETSLVSPTSGMYQVSPPPSDDSLTFYRLRVEPAR